MDEACTMDMHTMMTEIIWLVFLINIFTQINKIQLIYKKNNYSVFVIKFNE